LTCASASNTGNTCQLSLTYTPAAAASGSLQLNYSFQAHSGTVKTGSVTIQFVATTHNVLVTTQDPSGTIGAVVNSGSVPVTLTFTTNDGNPATAVTITSNMSTLPAGLEQPGHRHGHYHLCLGQHGNRLSIGVDLRADDQWQRQRRDRI
jgi:hypothetical protein